MEHMNVMTPSNISFSRINFYPDNTYSIYASSCLTREHDSGSFVLSTDTIYFTSFNADKLDTNNLDHRRTMTGEKLVYQKGKIYFLNHRTITVDTTMCWTKDTKKD